VSEPQSGRKDGTDSKAESLTHLFLAAAAGAAGTAIVALIFSSATFEWINRFIQLPLFPRGAVIFVQDKDCAGLGRDWARLDAADGKYIRAAAKDDTFAPGQGQPGGKLKFNIDRDNLPALTSILKYKAGNVPSEPGARHVVITIGGNPNLPDANQVGSPATEGELFEFPIKVGGVGAAREIDVTPPFIPLTACQKK
jgi:hypothetical protein